MQIWQRVQIPPPKDKTQHGPMFVLFRLLHSLRNAYPFPLSPIPPRPTVELGQIEKPDRHVDL